MSRVNWGAKPLMYFVLTGIIITCTVGCHNNNTVTVPGEDYIVEDSDDLGTASIDVTDDKQQDTTADKLYAGEGGTPEYLFDRFLHGEIDAEVLNPLEPDEWAFEYTSINISSLNFEPEEWSWDAYYFGGKMDLDNDGENEFILNGPYGGMYFDIIDGTLYVFAAGRGNAGGLKYTYYDDAYWIVYHDTTHGGRLCYWLYKYEGADNLVDSMTLMGFWNSEDDKEFTFNGESITEGEFNRIHDEIFESNDEE